MNLKTRIGNSRLAQDSLWAVCGNGLGYGLLLLAGIVIARYLGKDIYGEYGLVKTTMIYIAGFATLGLGISSTKYIADALQTDRTHVRALARDALTLSFWFSLTLALAVAAAATPLARFLKEPGLTMAFRVLAVIIIFKALNTTQNGILAGFGAFKSIARNNVASGAVMLTCCWPLTWWLGLDGAFISLAASQGLNALLNYFSLRRRTAALTGQEDVSRRRELFLFSFPIALQELNYTVCNWGGIALLTKLSSVGQVGIYTATMQWNGIITFIPGLLSNVILSHLSGTTGNARAHRHTLRTMLGVNFITTLIPFVVIYILAGWIAGFYGPTFTEMKGVMRVLMLATIFSACATVLYHELLSRGHNWLLLGYRIFQDAVILGLTWVLLLQRPAFPGSDGAMYYAIGYVSGALIYFSILLITVKAVNRKQDNRTIKAQTD